MKQDVLQNADQYMKERRRKKWWHKVVISLAAIVVFCTTYALILPAVTLEKDAPAEEEQAGEESLMQLNYTGPDYTVAVQYGKDAGIPEGSMLKASEIPKDSEEYQKYLSQAVEAMNASENMENIKLARFFDVQLLRENEKIEPKSPMEVTISYQQTIETGEETICKAVHFVEGDVEVLDAAAKLQTDGTTAFTHTQTGLSVVGDVVIEPDTQNEVMPLEEPTPDPGNTKVDHSVTFKVMVDGEWKTVGTSPNYYSGEMNGSERAYITSDMAKQFFDQYGYVPGTSTTANFGYSYNDIYTMFYANDNERTAYCMDIDGGVLENERVVQLWTSNNTDAQIFRVRAAESGYSFITPIGNSALYVNAYGYASGDASGTQLKLSDVANVNSQWKVDTGEDGRTTFWSAIAPEDQVIDLSGNDIKKGGKLQLWHYYGGARYWYMEQKYRISNDAVIVKNDDNTYNIGLTPESNGDIVCYYLPGESESAYANTAESGIDKKNSFWSVSVRDDAHAVYTAEQLDTMTQVVSAGENATVRVQNKDEIIWSCRGVNGDPVDVQSTQADGYTTFAIHNITQPIEITANKTNPSFKVQYYANIQRYATSGDNPLKVIDTSGKELPTNGGTMATRNLYLEGIGRQTTQNAGVKTEMYKVSTVRELTRMYTEKTCQYNTEPDLQYFNKLKDNEDFELKEIWVLKEGRSAGSKNREDWEIYTYTSGTTSFTNEAGQANANTILIDEGTVIRLVYDPNQGEYHNSTTFYDYNISSGKNTDGRWRTGKTGINSAGNYGTSLNGLRNWNSGADILAFGNQNCGTGMSGYLFDGGALNKANDRNSNYGKATFGIASGLNDDGTIRYNEWIVAPKLFNDGDAEFKQTYQNSSLAFERVGDTYTLSSATLANSNGKSNTIQDLQYFFHPSPHDGCIWDGNNSGLSWQSNIFTNNFWPLDQAAGRTDALWGKYGNTGTFAGFDENGSALNKDFPPGDDGRAHNWFFGMNFALSFNLDQDYVGPLDYYFFGDDDLWVFLDNQLVCDIGGVHSSIGEYVNLRDYLPEGSSGQHTLSFFYTERGASGSTCYMSFNLPLVSSSVTSREVGDLCITKTLQETENMDYSGEEYEFKVELLTKQGGDPLNQTFSYTLGSIDDNGSVTYGTVKSGGTIKLHQNEKVVIGSIPAGTYYKVTELTTAGYVTTVNGAEGYIVAGTIENGKETPAAFVNKPCYELPNTGGTGTIPYAAGGILLISASGFLLYIHIKRRKEGIASS